MGLGLVCQVLGEVVTEVLVNRILAVALELSKSFAWLLLVSSALIFLLS